MVSLNLRKFVKRFIEVAFHCQQVLPCEFRICNEKRQPLCVESHPHSGIRFFQPVDQARNPSFFIACTSDETL